MDQIQRSDSERIDEITIPVEDESNPDSILYKSKRFITVALYDATDLPKVDLVGCCDPYIKLVLGEQDSTSKVLPKTMSPVWNQLFTFELRSGYTFRFPGLELQLYDHNDITSDKYLGTVLLEWRHVALGGHFRIPIFADGTENIIGNLSFKVINAEINMPGEFEQGCSLDENPKLKGKVDSFIGESIDGLITDLSAERHVAREPVQVSNILERLDGSFTIVLLSGSGLPKVDWFGCCDPYVKFLVGDRTLAESQWLRETMSPTWNQLFSFDVNPEEFESSEGVTLEIWDHNNHNPDKYIGHIFLKWPHMHLGGIFRVPIIAGSKPGEVNGEQAGTLEFQVFSAKVIMDGFTQGFIINDEERLAMHDYAQITENELVTDLDEERDTPEETMFEKNSDNWFEHSEDHLLIAILSATGLPKMDLFGLSDAYVTISVGEQRAQTAIKYITLTPMWNQIFQFNLNPPFASAVPNAARIEVFDKDNFKADDFIGRVLLQWDQLVGDELELDVFSEKENSDPQNKEQYRHGKLKLLALKCKITSSEFKQGMKVQPNPFQECLKRALNLQPKEVVQLEETLEVTHLENIEVVVDGEVKSEP